MVSKKVSVFLVFVLFISMFIGIPASAAENVFGNAWVYDEAQVISSETEEYIQDLNENVFAAYRDKPQVAFVVVNTWPYDVDQYKLDLFNELGVGTIDENCGMLFLLAVDAREYAFEIGDGFKEGSLLRKDLEADFISEDMKDAAREGDYDRFVLLVAQYLDRLMADAENGVYEQKEAELKANTSYAFKFSCSFPKMDAPLIYSSYTLSLEDYQNCSFLIQNSETSEYLVAEFSAEDQAYIVTGSTAYESLATRFCCGMTQQRPKELFVYGMDAAEYLLVQTSVPYGYVELENTPIDMKSGYAMVGGSSTKYEVHGNNYFVLPLKISYAINESEQAVLTENHELNGFGVFLCFVCPVLGLVSLAVFAAYKFLWNRKLKDLIERNYKYIPSAKTTREEFAKYMNREHSDVALWNLEGSFLTFLYQLYYDKQMDALVHMAPVPERLRMYQDAFKKANDFNAFRSGQIVSLDMIFYKVDDTERQKAETRRKNKVIVEQFFADNESRIENKEIASQVRESLDSCLYSDCIVDPKELEVVFSDALDEHGFRWEFDRFCKENKHKINEQDFDQDAFYRAVTNSEDYRNYRASGHYDRSWMMPILMMHMSSQRRNRQEKERREYEKRQDRERQRRQEEARRAAERMSSNNSSFGSSFKGGSSSGGGFKGKW